MGLRLNMAVGCQSGRKAGDLVRSDDHDGAVDDVHFATVLHVAAGQRSILVNARAVDGKEFVLFRVEGGDGRSRGERNASPGTGSLNGPALCILHLFRGRNEISLSAEGLPV